MHSLLSLVADGAWWLLITALAALWGAFCVWAITKLIRKVRALPTNISKKREEKERSGRVRRAGFVRGFFRWLSRRDLFWTRRYRFDTLWIQRESNRGHACLVIFAIYFGLWVMAVGLKEVFIIDKVPLAESPSMVFFSATPMYLFEIAWLRYSGRAAQLISYRQKVRIWRWWH